MSGTYHPSGDEFILQALELQAVDESMKRALERLSRSNIEATKADGTKITLTGLGFSYGTGSTIEDAESRLKEHKKQREAQGLRAARGEQPPGATISSWSRKGGQDNQDHATNTQEQVAQTINEATTVSIKGKEPEVSPPSEGDKKATEATTAAASNELEGVERIRAMAARLTGINPKITGNASIKTARQMAKAIDTGVHSLSRAPRLPGAA